MYINIYFCCLPVFDIGEMNGEGKRLFSIGDSSSLQGSFRFYVIFQNEMMRQLHVQNLHLWQQKLMLDLKSGCTSGDVQYDKSNAPLLHTKLKQAARCIAHLRREKQQLIEMGNSLRAQITTTGIQGTTTSSLTTHLPHTVPQPLWYKLATKEYICQYLWGR